MKEYLDVETGEGSEIQASDGGTLGVPDGGTVGVPNGGGFSTPSYPFGTPSNGVAEYPDVTSGSGDVGSGYYYENQNNLGERDPECEYYFSEHGSIVYGTWEIGSKLKDFNLLFGSCCLLIFTWYLFMVTKRITFSRLAENWRLEGLLSAIFGASIIYIPCLWIGFIFWLKGIPWSFFEYELVNYPNQFIPGLATASLFLLSISIFRLTTHVFMVISEKKENENSTENLNYSIVTFLFTTLAVIANIITILTVFKNT